MRAPGLALVVALAWASIGHAAPDEDKLGKQSGYPVGNASNWYKLVIVQTGANATAEAGQNSLGADRNAFWRGVVGFYGKW